MVLARGLGTALPELAVEIQRQQVGEVVHAAWRFNHDNLPKWYHPITPFFFMPLCQFTEGTEGMRNFLTFSP